jgi:quinol-cytochrome oxidoreductase complex cytochrome b subunit
LVSEITQADEDDGAAVGARDGATDRGLEVGLSVGVMALVGEEVEEATGIRVGAYVLDATGAADGKATGYDVGLNEGDPVEVEAVQVVTDAVGFLFCFVLFCVFSFYCIFWLTLMPPGELLTVPLNAAAPVWAFTQIEPPPHIVVASAML